MSQSGWETGELLERGGGGLKERGIREHPMRRCEATMCDADQKKRREKERVWKNPRMHQYREVVFAWPDVKWAEKLDATRDRAGMQKASRCCNPQHSSNSPHTRARSSVQNLDIISALPRISPGFFFLCSLFLYFVYLTHTYTRTCHQGEKYPYPWENTTWPNVWWGENQEARKGSEENRLSMVSIATLRCTTVATTQIPCTSKISLTLHLSFFLSPRCVSLVHRSRSDIHFLSTGEIFKRGGALKIPANASPLNQETCVSSHRRLKEISQA